MEWTLFIFKRSFHYYLVSAESEEDAWKQLSMRQSCSLKNAQKNYKLIKTMNANSDVVKL
jgi:hypothetical protein